MLILARKINESIMIGDQIEVSVVDIKGDQVKIGISAPRQVKVFRREVYRLIQEENRQAALASPELLPTLEGLPSERPKAELPRTEAPKPESPKKGPPKPGFPGKDPGAL
jgi:carbon storage regulator